MILHLFAVLFISFLCILALLGVFSALVNGRGRDGGCAAVGCATFIFVVFMYTLSQLI